MCQYCQPLISAIDRYIEKADKKVTDKLKQQGYADPKATRKAMDGIEDGVAEALEEQTDYMVDELGKRKSLESATSSLKKIAAADALPAAVAAVVQKQLNNVLPNLIDSYIKQTDRQLQLLQVSERTSAWVHDWSEELGKLMNTDSYNELERILTNAMEQGQDIATVTRAIQESGIREERYRARRVALTETLRAHSVAQQEAFSQSPSVKNKGWKHTGEYRNEPRENHVDMDGQIVPVDEPFTLIGRDGETYYPMYPRDPNLPASESINCHCAMQPIVDEDILGMSLEERKAMQEEWFEEDHSDWEAELNERNKWKNVPEEDRPKELQKEWDESLHPRDELGRFTESGGGGGAGGAGEEAGGGSQAEREYQHELSSYKDEVMGLSDEDKAVELASAGYIKEDEIDSLLASGRLDDKMNEYFGILERNGSVVSEKPLTADNSGDAKLDAKAGLFGSQMEAMTARAEEVTGLSTRECAEMAEAINFWTQDDWEQGNTALLDKYIENDHTYDGEIYRGISFSPEDGDYGYDAALQKLTAGAVVNVGADGRNASWSNDFTLAEGFADVGHGKSDSIIFTNKANKSASPIRYYNEKREAEVLSDSKARYTVIGVTETVKSGGGRLAEVTVIECGEYADK